MILCVNCPGACPHLSILLAKCPSHASACMRLARASFLQSPKHTLPVKVCTRTATPSSAHPCESPLPRVQVPFVPARVYTPGSPVWQPALARYMDCMAPKDWALAWSALPVVHTDEEGTAPAPAPAAGVGAPARGGRGLPPASAWSMLRLRSPPPFDAIVQHLGRVGAPAPALAPAVAGLCL
jgi:hypothetical protein